MSFLAGSVSGGSDVMETESHLTDGHHGQKTQVLANPSVQESTLSASTKTLLENSSHITHASAPAIKKFKYILPKGALLTSNDVVKSTLSVTSNATSAAVYQTPICTQRTTPRDSKVLASRPDQFKFRLNPTAALGCEGELAEYCLVDCNDGQYALMPTSSESSIVHKTPKNDVFNQMWQLPGDMCRICARRCDSIEKVFSKRSKQSNLLDLIHNHLPIVISREDVLPLNVCSSCISSLQVADKLVKTCVAADKTLRTLLEHVCRVSLSKGNQNFIEQNESTEKIPTSVDKEVEGDDSVPHYCPVVNDHTYVSTVYQPLSKVKGKLSLAQLLSENDINAIKEMKAEGLKVTLVRLPKLSNLSDESKHKTVMEILKTLQANPAINKLKDSTSKVVVVAGSTVSSVSTTAACATKSYGDSRSKSTAIFADEECNNDIPMETGESNWVADLGIFDSVLKRADNNKTTNTLEDKFSENGFVVEDDGSITIANCTFSKEEKNKIKQEILAAHDGSITIANCTFSKEEKNKITQEILAAHAAKLMKKQMKSKKTEKLYHENHMIQNKVKEFNEKNVSLHCGECNLSCNSKEELLQHRKTHFQCKFCDRQLQSRTKLIEHERIHTNEKPFVCELCGMRFRRKQQLRDHSQRHDPEKRFKCDTCGKCFSVRTTFNAHIQRHNTESPFLCETCGKSFKLQAALRFHKLCHRTFTCTICSKSFSYRALQLHKKMHSGEGLFPCSVCGKQFLSNQRLKIHAIIHEGTYPYSCGVCHRSFKRLTHLQAHRKCHPSQLLGVLFYKCAVCNETFEEASLLSSHLHDHSPEERLSTKSFKCSTCSKCFSEEHDLQIHEEVHTDVKRYSCSTCSQYFASREELDEHASDHFELKPFACDICGKRFAAILNLNHHKSVHLDTKSFSCELCDKCFKTLNGLNQHKMVHSDVRRFSCSICNMSFKRKEALKNHERTHFSERPFTCSVCDRSFKVKADCVAHVKRHRVSGVEGSVIESYFNCPVCSKMFTLKVDLANHVQAAHSVDMSMFHIEVENDSLLCEETSVSPEHNVI